MPDIGDCVLFLRSSQPSAGVPVKQNLNKATDTMMKTAPLILALLLAGCARSKSGKISGEIFTEIGVTPKFNPLAELKHCEIKTREISKGSTTFILDGDQVEELLSILQSRCGSPLMESHNDNGRLSFFIYPNKCFGLEFSCRKQMLEAETNTVVTFENVARRPVPH